MHESVVHKVLHRAQDDNIATGMNRAADKRDI
jgi:hypothetical protein